MRRAWGLVIVAALLASAMGAAAQTVAEGEADGRFKPRDCYTVGQVLFEVDTANGHGTLQMPATGASACLVGFQEVVWRNACRQNVTGWIVCGDDDLSDDNATAKLGPDGSFAFANSVYKVSGTLTRVSVP